MKKILLLVMLLVSLTTTKTFSQGSKKMPYKEYEISLSEYVVSLKPGETKQVTMNIQRSKIYSKSKATLGLSSVLPAGVTVSYSPSEGYFDSSVASISVADNVKAGEYQLILKSTLRNKIKGIVLKLIVADNAIKDSITAN